MALRPQVVRSYRWGHEARKGMTCPASSSPAELLVAELPLPKTSHGAVMNGCWCGILKFFLLCPSLLLQSPLYLCSSWVCFKAVHTPLILQMCLEIMFRNQPGSILLALRRWKPSSSYQTWFFLFGIWPNLLNFPSWGRLTWRREVHAPLHARNRFVFCMEQWVLWEQTGEPLCYPIWNTVG